jgi:hypothetical protein
VPDQKRHHFVPEFYLRRFGTEKERVLERCRDGREFVTNVINVAAKSGFYDIILRDSDKSNEVEDHLSKVEGAAGRGDTVDRRLNVRSTARQKRGLL